MRPQVHYRERLLQQLRAIGTRTVLEVGCGGGGFLRGARELGVQIRGLDPEEHAVSALREEGYAADVGHAETLPFGDDSFDAVVVCYSAHHIADWNAALLEATRVARTVLILDPWYDLGIASQAVASEFDRWSKAIDRETGVFHADCMDANALLAPLASQLRAWHVRLEYVLELFELGVERMREIGEQQLSRIADPSPHRAAFAALLESARAQGFSDDGAVLLTLERRPRYETGP
jgi:SAM-dependent methyltransferase